LQDPEIEQKLEDVKQLIRIWHQFYKILVTIFTQPKDADIVKLDADFQKIKTTVAQKHHILMAVVTKDKHIAQTVLATVRRTISLVEFKALSTVEINKVLIEWHEANVLLNETLGHLEYERDTLADQTMTGKKAKESMDHLQDALSKVWHNPYFRLFLKVTITVGTLTLIYVYREDINNNEFYIKYLKGAIDWIGEKTKLADLFKWIQSKISG
jgi:hypothetical protein